MKTINIESYLTKDEADILFEHLLNINWLSVVKARREQFMATEEGLIYAYGKKEWSKDYVSIAMTDLVKKLTDRINDQFNSSYNVVFLNRYDSNQHNINWHADNSVEMDHGHAICVLSLGQERRIQTKLIESKNFEEETKLKHGSLFVMPDNYQTMYHHRIPKEGFVCSTRISLTFRHYI
jgi:alkylated DNA repair dioxygenase AlkB